MMWSRFLVAASDPSRPGRTEPQRAALPGVLRRKCACGQHTLGGGECEACRKGHAESPALVHEVVHSPGTPLDRESRGFMESRFGHDFGAVRVHSDSRAAASAQAVNALAYTVGEHVVFSHTWGAHSAQDQPLLAHELAHVVQNARHRSDESALDIAAPDGPAEAEADRAAAAVTAGTRLSGPLTSTRSVLRRKPAPCGEVPNLEGKDLKDPNVRKQWTDVNCVSSDSQKVAPECELTRAQRKTLQSSQQEAASRVQRALARLGVAEGRSFARDLATRLFATDPPTVSQITARLRNVQTLLSGSDALFAGRTCGDEGCQRAATAYVLGPNQLPIRVCPTAFSRPSELYRTVVHEALHWSGLDADPATPEGYCAKFDCLTPCLSKEDADAWAHYVTCLGEPLGEKRSFKDKILESVNEMP